MMDWIERHRILRKIVILTTLWMTVTAFRWSMSFAMMSDKAGVEIAAIIASIMTPLSVLQGATFTFQTKGEHDDKNVR